MTTTDPSEEQPVYLHLNPHDPAEWRPEGSELRRTLSYRAAEQLAPGDLVIWERRPYRTVSNTLDDPFDWPASTRERWAEFGMPDPASWARRPFTLVLRPELEPAGKLVHLSVVASYSWWILPEHFSVCRLCAQLPPCSHVYGEQVMEHAEEAMNDTMSIMPGCCLDCREPVTKRQKTIMFEGPHLMRPDFPDDSAIFHARQACRYGASRYDAKWAVAEPGRKLKLYCAGHVRHHYDGTVECTEGAECPGSVGGELVNHRGSETHDPAYRSYASGCWCVSGDLAAQPSSSSASNDS